MKAIIIEDEISSQEYLKQILFKNFPDIQIVAIVDNVPDGILAINDHRPNIVFLDVEIKMGTGFDVLSAITNKTFEVIFTTAFNAFAVDAFRHSAIDYLLKPLIVSDVIVAVEKCLKRFENGKSAEIIDQLLLRLQYAGNPKTKLTIYTVDGLEFVEISDIVFSEAKGNYTNIWLKDGSKITTSKKLKEIEGSLPKHIFFRVHHSYIVNLNSIKKYYRGKSSYVLLIDGNNIPVSSARKDDFINWLA